MPIAVPKTARRGTPTKSGGHGHAAATSCMNCRSGAGNTATGKGAAASWAEGATARVSPCRSAAPAYRPLRRGLEATAMVSSGSSHAAHLTTTAPSAQ